MFNNTISGINAGLIYGTMPSTSDMFAVAKNVCARGLYFAVVPKTLSGALWRITLWSIVAIASANAVAAYSVNQRLSDLRYMDAQLAREFQASRAAVPKNELLKVWMAEARSGTSQAVIAPIVVPEPARAEPLAAQLAAVANLKPPMTPVGFVREDTGEFVPVVPKAAAQASEKILVAEKAPKPSAVLVSVKAGKTNLLVSTQAPHAKPKANLPIKVAGKKPTKTPTRLVGTDPSWEFRVLHPELS